MSLCAIIVGSRRKGSKIFCTEDTITWTWKESLAESLAFITSFEVPGAPNNYYPVESYSSTRYRSYFFTVLGELQVGRREKIPLSRASGASRSPEKREKILPVLQATGYSIILILNNGVQNRRTLSFAMQWPNIPNMFDAYQIFLVFVYSLPY